MWRHAGGGDCVFAEAEDGSDLDSIRTDEDEYDRTEDMITSEEELLCLTAYRADAEIKDALAD